MWSRLRVSSKPQNLKVLEISGLANLRNVMIKRVCAGIVLGWVTSQAKLCGIAPIDPTIGIRLGAFLTNAQLTALVKPCCYAYACRKLALSVFYSFLSRLVRGVSSLSLFSLSTLCVQELSKMAT